MNTGVLLLVHERMDELTGEVKYAEDHFAGPGLCLFDRGRRVKQIGIVLFQRKIHGL